MPELEDELLELEEEVVELLLELELAEELAEELDELLEVELPFPPQAINNVEPITARDILLKPDMISPFDMMIRSYF